MVAIIALLLLQDSKLAPDVSLAKIAATPVSGLMGGKPFCPTRAEFQRLGPTNVKTNGKVADESIQHVLKFMVGNDFIPDQEVSIWITFDEGQPLAPRTWHWKPTAFNTDAYRRQSYPVDHPNGNVARGLTAVFTPNKKNGIVNDGFSAHLKFEKVAGEVLVGSVALVLPDRSYLNGRFQAHIVR